jgi:two-component system sensor histidine kinase UhpB
MGLRFRVNLAISIIGLIFVLVTAFILIDDRKKSINEEMEAGTKVTVQLLESFALNPILASRGNDPSMEFASFLRGVGRVRANEIRLYDSSNELVYESPPSEYKSGRWAPQWFANLVAPARRDFRLNMPIGTIVITPDSSRSVLDAWDELSTFGLILIGFFILLNLTTFGLIGRSLRPLNVISSAMSSMERGDLTTRLPRFSLPEFDSIGYMFNRMASNLEDALTQNARLALVAQQSSDAIMIHDLEGKISFWNPAAERIFGFQSQEILGKAAQLIVPDDLVSEMDVIQDGVVRRKRIEYLETKRKTKSGELIDVALSIAPLVDPVHQEIIGEICAIRDMTEHKQRIAVETELLENRKLTQLIQEKLEEERKSIARELHDELGQCVTAIKTIGAAIANRAGDKDVDTSKNAITIVEVATHIYDVVHSIIRELRPSALDHLGLEDALIDIVDRYKKQSPDLDVAISFDVGARKFGEKLNITVYRVVQECLTNAAKHSSATRIDVGVGIVVRSQEGDMIRVSIEDNGIGIQSDIEKSTRFGLLGIKERVQAFGGEVVIVNPEKGGTRIEAYIPLHSS